MCKIKVKNDIKTEQDVQNLITAIILRQRGLYTKKYLLRATQYYLPDTREIVNEKQVKNMIDDTLSILHKCGKVNYSNGGFCPRINVCRR